MTWTCKKCGESVETTFSHCWNCGTEDDQPHRSLEPEVPAVQRTSPVAKPLPPFRYAEAYHLARIIMSTGSLIKLLGLLAGLAMLVLALSFARNDGDNTIVALGIALVGIVIGILVYALGLLLSATGQILLATLDTAVTNSPFLTHEEMKQTMNL